VEQDGYAGEHSGRDDDAGTERERQHEPSDGPGRRGSTEPSGASAAETDDLTPEELVETAVSAALEDPVAGGDYVGDLLAVVRDCEPPVSESAAEALNLLGYLRPGAFAVWVDDLVAFASDRDGDLAFVGLRALAQLAGENSRAAAKGLDAALDRVTDPRTETRQAALSVVAEVGADAPDRVRRADRDVMAAIRDEEPGVRLAGVIAAGTLLGADPQSFPRSATVLFEALDDEHDRVWEYAHVALVNFAREHPSQVPEKTRAMEALARVSDEDLGVREGATKDALTALLALERGFDL
jgi:hypothetical protein